jgi:outer membrane protein TolC
MEEYNAQIGAAMAAFYPDVKLTATYSYSGDPVGSLVQVANRIWTLGASATETLFAGGARTAAVHEADSNYNAYVATYRQTVLTALQGVEDQLSNLRILADQAEQQHVALDAANKAVTVAFNQYMAGTQIYTTVITAEVTAMSNAQTALQIQQSRILDSVSLVEALGGGWNASELPSKNSMQTDNPLLPSFIQKDKN